MQRGLFGLACLMIVFASLGCGPSEPETGAGGSPSTEGATAKGGGPTGEGEIKGDVEVQAFQGGFDIDFYQQAAKEFNEKHPGAKATVGGNPRIWDQLRPRFIGGTPPDLAFPGWGMDHWALVDEGQVLALDDALDSKPAEGEGKWRDSFDAQMLKIGQSNGKQYVMPYYVNVMGWWYDPGVFSKNGWTVPKTYAELLTLCEKIKSKGIAPLTFQGQYPYYMVTGMLVPWARSIGGKEVVDAAQNMEPGAWKSPAFVQAAKMIDELNKKGYFESGAVAMTHTQSQQEFVQGKAAMIPCGTWLETEMKKVTPPNAKMAFFLPPVVEGGKGEPSAVIVSIEPWMVPSGAKNPNGAVALFKYMTSPAKAKQFVEQKGTLMAIKGIDDARLPDTLVEAAKAMRESKDIYAELFRDWYKDFSTEMQNALTAMLNGESTPEQFCDRVEKAAQKVRDSKSIVKRKLS